MEVGNLRPDIVLEEQWKALPDFIGDGENFLCVVDNSGSMYINNMLPLTAAVSLGIYCSERSKGIFRNHYISFSQRPRLLSFGENTTLRDKIDIALQNSDMSNTDLEKTFSLILNSACANNVPENEMPTTVLILSDMQFDRCSNSDYTAIEMIRSMYEGAGYKLPKIVFWNLNSRGGFPIRFNDSGVCIVSGYSPSILKNVLSGKISPVDVMLSVLDSSRYTVIDYLVNQP